MDSENVGGADIENGEDTTGSQSAPLCTETNSEQTLINEHLNSGDNNGNRDSQTSKQSKHKDG